MCFTGAKNCHLKAQNLSTLDLRFYTGICCCRFAILPLCLPLVIPIERCRRGQLIVTKRLCNQTKWLFNSPDSGSQSRIMVCHSIHDNNLKFYEAFSFCYLCTSKNHSFIEPKGKNMRNLDSEITELRERERCRFQRHQENHVPKHSVQLCMCYVHCTIQHLLAGVAKRIL